MFTSAQGGSAKVGLVQCKGVKGSLLRPGKNKPVAAASIPEISGGIKLKLFSRGSGRELC